MKNSILLVLNFIFVLSASAQDIDALIRSSKINRSDLGILIISNQSSGKTIYSLNQDEKMIPASLTKLVTASAVLEKMPKAHQFETKLVSNSNPLGNTLKSSLYLIGDGDPGFVSESMWVLVNNFLRTGIEVIDGDIIVDDSKFDQIRFDPSRDTGSVDRAYDSPIGAMTFNWSAVNIYVRPTDLKQEAKVTLDPANEYLRLINNVKTVAGKRSKISVSLRRSNKSSYIEDLVVSGTVGKDEDEVVIFRAIDKPDLWAGYNLKAFLERRGITVKGDVRTDSFKGSQKIVLATYKSKPIGEHISDMLKFSNNYVAEILAKDLAAEFIKKSARMEDGIEYLSDYLKAMGLQSFSLVNPSGLSRKNQFSARHFQKILENMRTKIHRYPEFFSGLPIAGVDGTLKSRMKDLPDNTSFRGKTGLLTGAVGLAGYLEKSNGEVLDLVFIFNGPANKTYAARQLADKIVISLK